MRGFGSDNHAPVHPKLLESIIHCNQDHAPSYGTDAYSEELTSVIKQLFGNHVKYYCVFNGTGANVISLKLITKSYETVLCTDISHLNNDECGAPEALGHFKLQPITSVHGKFDFFALQKSIVRKGDQHASQTKVISITQPTELGTCYTISELKQIISWAKNQNLLIHIDGARIANAARFLNLSFKELTTDLGVDVVSFGGTKNGFMMGELILILNPSLDAEALKYIRKQCLQLPSKTRYISTQFLTYFKSQLWQTIADHTHSMAKLLEQEIKKYPQLTITQAVESNAVFVQIPKELIKILKNQAFFYVWNEHTFECRLMTSWDTQPEDILKLLQPLKF